MILMLSKDSVLKRTVKLLLTDYQFTEEISVGHEILIFDADTENFDDFDLSSEMAVLFLSREEAAPKVSVNFRFLRRPFRNSELRFAVSELAGGLSPVPPENKLQVVFDKGGAADAVFGTDGVGLTRAEEKLLSALIKRDGEVLLRSEAAEFFDESETNVVDVYVSYLRKKLKKLHGAPQIVTVRGRGYALQKGELNR